MFYSIRMSKPVPKPKPSIKKKPSNIKVFTANWAYSAQVKWGAAARWSFRPNSAWGSIETMTIAPTLFFCSKVW